MDAFDQWMREFQIEWRKSNAPSVEHGFRGPRQYPHILPEDLWEEGLWPGIGSESENSLPTYLQRTGVQKHRYAHHLNSSWMLRANLHFPFRATADARGVFVSFLNRHVAAEIDSPEDATMSWMLPSSGARLQD